MLAAMPRYWHAFGSRGAMRPRFAGQFRPLETGGRGEGRVLAGTRGLVCQKWLDAHTSIQVSAGTSGLPCAVGLRLMPCSPRRRIRLVTVAGELTILSNPVGFAKSPPTWHQQRVPGPQGFAVRFSAVRPHDGDLSRETRPEIPFHAPTPWRPPQPVPTFVTMANAPLTRTGCAKF